MKMPDSIILEGDQIGRRYLSYINGQRFLMVRAEFRIMAVLAIGVLSGQEWVNRDVIYKPENLVRKYLYRIRMQVHTTIPTLDRWPVFEYDLIGKYRMLALKESIVMNRRNLRQLGYADLVECLELIDNGTQESSKETGGPRPDPPQKQ